LAPNQDNNNADSVIATIRTTFQYRATSNIYWNAQVKKWIAPDGGICHTCTPANGFPNPPQTQDGFFYLPNEKLWYDSDGAACNTCTPSNGFPVPPR
jgi:hypothetical protein